MGAPRATEEKVADEAEERRPLTAGVADEAQYGAAPQAAAAALRRGALPAREEHVVRGGHIFAREASFRVPIPFKPPTDGFVDADDTEECEFEYIEPAKSRGFKFFWHKLALMFRQDDGEESGCRAPDMRSLLAGVLVLVAIFVDGLRPIALVWAKDGHAKYPFDFSVWIMVVKGLVIVFSVFLYLCAPRDQRETDLTWREQLRLSVYLLPPTLLYVTSDLLNFFMFEYISASTFSVVKQSRLIIVGLLFRFALHRFLSQIQWVAIVQLLLASILFEADKQGAGDESLGCNKEAIGIAILLFKCLLDSLAIVWMDKYFKKLSTSGFPYPVQQIFYAVYGFLAGCVYFLLQGGFALHNPFRGWTTGAWVSAIMSAFYGLLVSIVLRYLDSLVKMLQSLMAIVVTIFFDRLWFGQEVDLVKSIAICFVLESVFLYKIGTVKPMHGKTHKP